MNNDLIERLKAFSNETVKLHAAQIMTIKDAITALSPVMPKHVEAVITVLKKHAMPIDLKAADMLERLQREKDNLRAIVDRDLKRMKEMEQSIEELSEFERITGEK